MLKYILWHIPVKDTASNIEKDMQYPGEIKISVIRETRVIEYAR